MDKTVRVWYDAEADFLEVILQDKPGVFRETATDEVMARIDADGRVIGFSILNVSKLRDRTLELSLAAAD